MKTIAVQRGLSEIKAKLEHMGHHVVYHDEVQSPVDAYIYAEDNDYAHQSLYTANQVLTNVFSSVGVGLNHDIGTLLINAQNKTIDEINFILGSRVYSPLF